MNTQDKFRQYIEGLQRLSPQEKSLKKEFIVKIKTGKFVQENDPVVHFGIFFWPYNPKTKEVFITHHKKSGLWLAAGGHMERGEMPYDTAVREAREELGFVLKNLDKTPFMISKTPVNMPGYQCRVHYDIWYLLPTDGQTFDIDPQEFFDTKWVKLKEAEKFLTQENQRKALHRLLSLSS